MKYLSLYYSFLKINIITELQFRTNLLFHLFTMFLSFLSNIFFYYFLYNNVNNIAGWNKYEMYILASTVIIINSIFGGIFFFNLIQIPRKVRNYELDYLLLKPINTIFYISLKDFNVGLFSGSIFGIFLLIYSIIKLKLSIGIINILAYILLINTGVLILYSVLFFMVTFSLKFVRVNGLIQMFWTTMSIGNNPYSIYPKIIKYLGLFIIPSIIIYNFPALSIINNNSLSNLTTLEMTLLALLITFIFISFAINFFNKSLKYYYN